MLISAKQIALLPLLGAGLLAACSSEPTCDYSSAPYVTATSVAPLRAPEGLTAPDRSAALTIPPAASGQTSVVPSGKGKCLDRPPSYFSTTPHADAPGDKKSPEK